MKLGELKHKGIAILPVLGLIICLGLAACTGEAPTPATAPTPPSTSPPALTPAPATEPTPAPAQEPAPVLEPEPVPPAPEPEPDPEPAPEPEPEPVSPEPAEVNIISDRTITDFPNTIAFIIEGSSAVPVASINLEYGTDKRSLVSEVSRVEPEYATDIKISTSYVWEMKKTGSIPPGAKVWWRWRITDEDDRTYVTPRQTIVFEDTRYQWQVETAHDLDIYWYSLGASLVKELTEGVESRLARVKLEVDIPEERKPKVFVYPNSEELRSAVLFTQEWAGAMAFLDYDIILIPVQSGNLEWAKRTLAHEITHLLVREATFGPFGDIPTWLDEGLAQYAEGEMEEYHRQALDDAIKENTLLSVRSLGSSFPADPDRASLAYAQSLSLVSYLVDTYGWDKMRELIAVFKEGSTYDSAIREVYDFDTDGLEERWRTHIGAS